MDRITAITPNVAKRVRMGLKKCGHCKGQFTVRMGTIFEESKLPLRIWLQAMHLMASSKKGISAHQLHRTLEITYKSAWFLAHRIRGAMRYGVPTHIVETVLSAPYMAMCERHWKQILALRTIAAE